MTRPRAVSSSRRSRSRKPLPTFIDVTRCTELTTRCCYAPTTSRVTPISSKGRYFGPFTITAVGPVTVTLALPDDMRMHSTVHVEKVKRYTPSVGEWVGRVQGAQPAPEVDADGELLWEVEAIAGKRVAREKVGRKQVEDGALPRLLEGLSCCRRVLGSVSRILQALWTW